MRYLMQCPKCKSELENVCEWDIVTDQYCSNPECNFHKNYGSAQFYDGVTFLSPNRDIDLDFLDF